MSASVTRTIVKRFPDDHSVTLSARDKTGYKKPIMETSDINNPTLMRKVSEIVGNNGAWVIIDCQKVTLPDQQEFHIVILSTTDMASIEQRKKLDGMIINIEDKRIIFSDNQDMIETTTDIINYGKNAVTSWEHCLDINKIKIVGSYEIPKDKPFMAKCAYTGVGIRVFVEKGIMFRATKKKIWTPRSRWGGSTSFSDMYDEAGGPTKEELFGDEDIEYSSHLYDFTVVHPQLLTATKQTIKTPFMVYNNVFTINKKLVPTGKKTWTSPTRVVPTVVTSSGVYQPFVFRSLEKVNRFLSAGYIRGPGHSIGGEAVTYKSQHGIIYKIKPLSYSFGVNLRGPEFFVDTRIYQTVDNCLKMVHGDNTRPFLKGYHDPHVLGFYIKNSESCDIKFVNMMSDVLAGTHVENDKRISDINVVVSNFLFHSNPVYIPTIKKAYNFMLDGRSAVADLVIDKIGKQEVAEDTKNECIKYYNELLEISSDRKEVVKYIKDIPFLKLSKLARFIESNKPLEN